VKRRDEERNKTKLDRFTKQRSESKTVDEKEEDEATRANQVLRSGYYSGSAQPRRCLQRWGWHVPRKSEQAMSMEGQQVSIVAVAVVQRSNRKWEAEDA
jgi:hypothetical protein